MRSENRFASKESLNDFKHRVVVFGVRGFLDKPLFDFMIRKFLKENNLDQEDTKDQVVFLTGMGKQDVGWFTYEWAKEHGYAWCEFHANWNDVEAVDAVVRERNGKMINVVAGLWRDEEMVEVATHGIVFHDGSPSNTKDMIDRIIDNGAVCHTCLVNI